MACISLLVRIASIAPILLFFASSAHDLWADADLAVEIADILPAENNANWSVIFSDPREILFTLFFSSHECFLGLQFLAFFFIIVEGQHDNSSVYLTKCSKCHSVHLIPTKALVLCINDLASTSTSKLRFCSDVISTDYAVSNLIEHLKLTDLFLLRQSDQDAEPKTAQSVDITGISRLDYVSCNFSALKDNFGDKLVVYYIRHFFVSVNIDCIVSKLSDFSFFGPDFSWIFDLRNDLDGQGERQITSILDDGDNVAIVTLSSFFKQRTAQSVREMVELNYLHPISRHDVLLEVKKCLAHCRALEPMTSVAEVRVDGFVIAQEEIFPKTFTGFKQKKFRVVTREYAPFVTKKIQNDTAVYDGLCIYLLNLIADALNFTYELYDVPDGLFGVEDSTGDWNGMIGEVHHRKADFAVNGITITSDREKVVDFTYPYWEEPTAVVLSHFANETKLFSLMKPLHWAVWVAAVANVLGAAAMMFLMTLLSQQINPLPSNMLSFGACFWYCYGAFFQQGGFDCPKNSPARMVASMWWIISIIIYAVYTGNLIAFLTVTETKMPFDTLQQMVKQTDYAYGVERGIVQHMLFEGATSGVYEDVWKGILTNQDNLVRSTQEGVNKTLSEMFAFIGEKTALEATTLGRCDVDLIQEEFFKSGFGFAMREKWPYTKYFNQIIMQLIEAGFVENWRLKNNQRDTCAPKGKALQAEPISLDGVSGSFILLSIGLVVAALSLCYECLEQRCCPASGLSSLAQHFVPTANSLILWRPSASPVQRAPVAMEVAPGVVELNNTQQSTSTTKGGNERKRTFHRNMTSEKFSRTPKVMNISGSKYGTNEVNVISQ